MAYVKRAVKRPEGNPGKGINPRDMMSIIDVDDILVFPARDSAGVLMTENIQLKPGCYSTDIYFTPGTVEVTSNTDGDPDALGFTPTVKGNHPGNKQAVREFKTNWLGRKCIVIMSYCDGQDKDLFGSPCNPMQMGVNYTGNKDANSSEFTFTQISKGDDIAIYKGTVPSEEPVANVSASATTIPFTAEGQYQLQGGEAEINKVTGGRHGAVMTLLGVASGVAPTIAHGGQFLLRGGETFTASPGSQITLQAFESGSGTCTWIEQSRYQA